MRGGTSLSCTPHNHPEAHRVPRYCGTGLTAQRLSLGAARYHARVGEGHIDLLVEFVDISAGVFLGATMPSQKVAS
jgi:hypothetical protein